jgi:hypothetical protein
MSGPYLGMYNLVYVVMLGRNRRHSKPFSPLFEKMTTLTSGHQEMAHEQPYICSCLM